MRAVVQDVGTGKLTVGEVPPPALQPGGVLVRVRSSLISAGTERAVMTLAKQGPIGKARARPDLARKVLNKAKQEGYWSTYKVVKNLMASPIPMGYSCAGEVIEVGEEAEDFRIGDRVACAGLNFANHAEFDFVPRNLTVRMPADVSFDAGSFVALGAIAMHGVRLGNVVLGDRVLVMGLGLVGQIAAQLARAAGATVVGFDPDAEKADLARSLGADVAVSDTDTVSAVLERITTGHGADVVLVCASAKSSVPLRQAADWVRLKGRVVVVGDVGMSIERRPYFEKEATLVVSRSYGPGRYDPEYEVGGQDYPLAYVRWTERRNMESFLTLVARDTVRLDALVTHRFPIEDAEEAYRLVRGERREPSLAIVLTYGGDAAPATRVPVRSTPSADQSGIRLGVIGAGQFAKGVLLPAFTAHRNLRVQAVCTVSGLTSRQVAERHGAVYCTSDPAEVIDDPDVNAILIATRHDQHAPLAARALRAGKAVFLEKPLAISEAALHELLAVASDEPRLFVGFNRRFAPLAVACRSFFDGRPGRLGMSYRVNAGRLPSDSWVLDPAVGGGRIVGEICHFVDFLCFLSDGHPEWIHAAQALSDDARSRDRDAVFVTLTMSDGSVGTIHYFASGDPSVPKEYVEVFGGGRAARLDNFRRLDLHAGNRRRRKRLLNQAKGHAEEVAAFLRAVEGGAPMPVSLDTLVATTQTTFLIHESLETGQTVAYRPPRSGDESA